jgi:hypothetical protein
LNHGNQESGKQESRKEQETRKPGILFYDGGGYASCLFIVGRALRLPAASHGSDAARVARGALALQNPHRVFPCFESPAVGFAIRYGLDS